MIKLSAITEMFKYHGDTLYKTNDLITEFDDSKDIFFKTIEDEYIAILKIDDENSILFSFSEHDIKHGEITYSAELKNNKINGRCINWEEPLSYAEYKNGTLNGYNELIDHEILDYRGNYIKGIRDGWWEFGDKYLEIEYYRKRDNFHSLENYRPATFIHYQNGQEINSLSTLDSEYEYELAVFAEIKSNISDKELLKTQIKEKVDKGEIYKGKKTNYCSYETYLKMTNLPNLKINTEACFASAINYDEIKNSYFKLFKKKEVSVDKFKNDYVQIWLG